MTTHYHLLVQTPQADLSAGMQRLNGLYAMRFNARHARRGHLFGARFHAIPVETESHLLETVRYLALNPVRAGACLDARDWPWSSYAVITGRSRNPLFAPGPLARFFGEQHAPFAHALRAFVEAGAGAESKAQSEPAPEKTALYA